MVTPSPAMRRPVPTPRPHGPQPARGAGPVTTSLDDATAAELVTRLRRIEGQVRGLQHMINRGDRCIDILTQIAATRAALTAVGRGVLRSEIRRAVGAGGAATPPGAGRGGLPTPPPPERPLVRRDGGRPTSHAAPSSAHRPAARSW